MEKIPLELRSRNFVAAQNIFKETRSKADITVLSWTDISEQVRAAEETLDKDGENRLELLNRISNDLVSIEPLSRDESINLAAIANQLAIRMKSVNGARNRQDLLRLQKYAELLERSIEGHDDLKEETKTILG